MVLKFVNQRGSTVSTPFIMGAPKLPVGFVQKAISPSSSESSLPIDSQHILVVMAVLLLLFLLLASWSGCRSRDVMAMLSAPVPRHPTTSSPPNVARKVTFVVNSCLNCGLNRLLYGGLN